MGIGERIKTAIESKGMSLKKAAAECDISYSSMQNWVGGHREPRPDALITLGSRLGISIDWLLTGEGPMLRGAADTAPVQPVPVTSEISPREQAILELFRALDEDGQREIQDAAAEKKRLNEIERRLAAVEAAILAARESA